MDDKAQALIGMAIIAVISASLYGLFQSLQPVFVQVATYAGICAVIICVVGAVVVLQLVNLKIITCINNQVNPGKPIIINFPKFPNMKLPERMDRVEPEQSFMQIADYERRYEYYE